jgi:hypothetical protein
MYPYFLTKADRNVVPTKQQHVVLSSKQGERPHDHEVTLYNCPSGSRNHHCAVCADDRSTHRPLVSAPGGAVAGSVPIRERRLGEKSAGH